MLWTWLIAGVALILIELVVPGLVLVFLGAGALVVAFLVWIGLVSSWITALTVWFISSLVLLLALRGLFMKLMPGESHIQSTDEDLDAYGEVVEVVETVSPKEGGRIRFRDITWSAVCYEQTIEAGEKAKIVFRENLLWIVEPCD